MAYPDWEYENIESGGTWVAGQVDIEAGMTINPEGQTVYAGQVGATTTWVLSTES